MYSVPAPSSQSSLGSMISLREICTGFQRISTETSPTHAPTPEKPDQKIKAYLPHDDSGMWQSKSPLKPLGLPDPGVLRLLFRGLSWHRQAMMFRAASLPPLPNAGLCSGDSAACCH